MSRSRAKNGKRIKALRLELKQSEGKRMDIDDFLTTVRRYTNATKITKRMVENSSTILTCTRRKSRTA